MNINLQSSPFQAKDELVILNELIERKIFPSKIKNYYDPFLSSGSIWQALSNKIKGHSFISDPRKELLEFWKINNEQFRIAIMIIKDIEKSFSKIQGINKNTHISQFAINASDLLRDQSKFIQNIWSFDIIENELKTIIKKIKKNQENYSGLSLDLDKAYKNILYNNILENWKNRMISNSLAHQYIGARVAFWYFLSFMSEEFTLKNHNVFSKCSQDKSKMSSLISSLKEINLFKQNEMFEKSIFIEKTYKEMLWDLSLDKDDVLILNNPFFHVGNEQILSEADYIEKLCTSIGGKSFVFMDKENWESITPIFNNKKWRIEEIKNTDLILLHTNV